MSYLASTRGVILACSLLCATSTLAAGSREAELSVLVQQMSGPVKLDYYDPVTAQPKGGLLIGRLSRITCEGAGWIIFQLRFDDGWSRIVRIPPKFKMTMSKTVNGRVNELRENDQRIVVIGRRQSKSGASLRDYRKDTEFAWFRKPYDQVIMTFTVAAFDSAGNSQSDMERYVIPVNQQKWDRVNSLCSQ